LAVLRCLGRGSGFRFENMDECVELGIVLFNLAKMGVEQFNRG
jgi:hypothetical protein